MRLTAFLILLTVASVSPAPAPTASSRAPFVYPMVFPLVGLRPAGVQVTRSFGDPRPGGRHHEGVDILAPKLTPVVAVADGTVRWMHDTRRGDCCDLAILHDDGWRSRYIHLNDDTPGTDDGEGYGIAPGLRVGARVRAGQLIGYVGDSGNAEHSVPHLHFELRRPDGTPVDPYPSLVAAEGRPGNPGTPEVPRIAGPPVRAEEGVPAEVLRPGKAPAAGGPGEGGGSSAEPARPLPVTPFLPVPAGGCVPEAGPPGPEVREPAPPTLSCYHAGSAPTREASRRAERTGPLGGADSSASSPKPRASDKARSRP